jgi:hypothetical protein
LNQNIIIVGCPACLWHRCPGWYLTCHATCYFVRSRLGLLFNFSFGTGTNGVIKCGQAQDYLWNMVSRICQVFRNCFAECISGSRVFPISLGWVNHAWLGQLFATLNQNIIIVGCPACLWHRCPGWYLTCHSTCHLSLMRTRFGLLNNFLFFFPCKQIHWMGHSANNTLLSL